MPEETININTPGGVKSVSGYQPKEGEIFKLDDYTVGRIQGGQLQQIDPQMYYKDKYGVNTGTDLEGARRLGLSGLGSQDLFNKFAQDVGFDVNNLNKADRGFLADAGYLRTPQYVSGTDFDFSSYKTPGQDMSGFQEQGMRDYTDTEKQAIFGGNTPNFKPQGGLVSAANISTQIYGQPLNVNGQSISPNDPNYDQYAQQVGAVGTPGVPLDGMMPNTFGRYLGPTEFDGLRKEWTQAFNDAGIRDINVINNAIEEEFLKRNGRDIYLNEGARSINDVIKDAKIRTQAQANYNNIASGSGSSVVSADEIRVDLPNVKPIVQAQPDALSNLANNIVDSTLKGIYNYAETERKKVETQRLQAEQEKEQLKGALGEMANDNYYERRTNEVLEEYKIKETNDKLTSVGEEMARIQESLGLRLSQEGERVGPLGFMTREKQQILEQGNARLAALASIAEVYRGNINVAMDLANTTLSAINADRENKINTYNTFLDMAEKDIVNFKAEEKDYMQRQMDILVDQVEETRKNKDFVMELILSNPLAAQMGGVTLLDSREQAVSKITKSMADIQKMELQQQVQSNTIFGETFSGSVSAQQLASAIRQVESGGNYQARGASGEFGAYQFMPGTWEQWSKEYLSARGGQGQSLPMTQANQDAVAQWKIQQWLDQGYKPDQIASMWNSGSPEYAGKVGTNKFGVNYNVPAYVDKVTGALTSLYPDLQPNIYLDDKQQKSLESTAEKKKLDTLTSLLSTITTYETLVDDYGIELFGKNTALLDNAYNNLVIAWKDAAELGALTGPDVQIIEGALLPSTGARGVRTYLMSGGADGILSQIDQMKTTLKNNAERNYNLLLQRDPAYKNSGFVKQLYEPFNRIENNQESNDPLGIGISDVVSIGTDLATGNVAGAVVTAVDPMGIR